jgi:hypothetical protein
LELVLELELQEQLHHLTLEQPLELVQQEQLEQLLQLERF